MNDIPRRIRLDKLTPAERAIFDASQAVEELPPDVRLTNATVHLDRARAAVADYVDGVAIEEEPAPDGVALIAVERARQVFEEDWTPEHDADHVTGILAIAAAELAVDGTDAVVDGQYEHDHCGSLGKFGIGGTKPDRIRALTIAGALIAAEIDRELAAETDRVEPTR